MKAPRTTAIELAIMSIAAGIIGLCVLIIPSSVSAPISAALGIIGIGLAAVAYRGSEEETGARTTSKVGVAVGVVVLFDILLGLGTMW